MKIFYYAVSLVCLYFAAMSFAGKMVCDPWVVGILWLTLFLANLQSALQSAIEEA